MIRNFTAIPTNAADIDFRNWGKAISDCFAALGWLSNGDTGQINWATVTRPLAASTVMGYEVWKTNDGMLSPELIPVAMPIVVKIEYGSGTGVAANPGIWLTVGNATNGAGTMVAGTTRVQVPSTVAGTTGVAVNGVASGDASRIICHPFHTGPNDGGIWFSLERTKTIAGVDSQTGILISSSAVNGAAVTTAFQQVYQNLTGQFAAEASLGIWPPLTGTGAGGGAIAIWPQLHTMGAFIYPGLNQLAAPISQVPTDTSISVNLYGSTHTYKSLGNGPINLASVRRGGYSPALIPTLLMRWE